MYNSKYCLSVCKYFPAYTLPALFNGPFFSFFPPQVQYITLLHSTRLGLAIYNTSCEFFHIYFFTGNKFIGRGAGLIPALLTTAASAFFLTQMSAETRKFIFVRPAIWELGKKYLYYVKAAIFEVYLKMNLLITNLSYCHSFLMKYKADLLSHSQYGIHTQTHFQFTEVQFYIKLETV